MTLAFPHLNTTASLINRGIEREALRITEDITLSQQPHPIALGSALKNPLMTTDFAECLPEIVTGVHDKVDNLLTELSYLHGWLAQTMPANEILWPASMPPYIADVSQIPIAEYGSSNSAKLKRLYRIGLSNRYGSAMQVIAGIHYNMSFSRSLLQALSDTPLTDAIQSELYMHTIRNFNQHQWLLLYLFSASPIIMRSSLGDTIPKHVTGINQTTYINPYATSLRLSPLGYHNIECQQAIDLSSVKHYAVDLLQRTQQPSTLYQTIADIFDPHPQQLNKNILQIENEFYNTIRPKPHPKHQTLPAIALYQHGVEYLEIRLFDINPFTPLGITKSQILLTDVLLTYCLLQEESENTMAALPLNDMLEQGHHPELNLKQKASELLKQLQPVAAWLDQQQQTSDFSQALAEQQNNLHNTLTKQLLDHQHNYQNMLYQLGKEHTNHFRQTALPKEIQQHYQSIAEQSLRHQHDLEMQDVKQSFIDYYEQTQAIPSKQFLKSLDKN